MGKGRSKLKRLQNEQILEIMVDRHSIVEEIKTKQPIRNICMEEERKIRSRERIEEVIRDMGLEKDPWNDREQWILTAPELKSKQDTQGME